MCEDVPSGVFSSHSWAGTRNLLRGLHDRELCYQVGFNRKGTIVGTSEVDEVVKTGIFWTGVAIKLTLGLERLRQERLKWAGGSG